jgi:hypothetical protein
MVEVGWALETPWGIDRCGPFWIYVVTSIPVTEMVSEVKVLCRWQMAEYLIALSDVSKQREVDDAPPTPKANRSSESHQLELPIPVSPQISDKTSIHSYEYISHFKKWLKLLGWLSKPFPPAAVPSAQASSPQRPPNSLRQSRAHDKTCFPQHSHPQPRAPSRQLLANRTPT